MLLLSDIVNEAVAGWAAQLRADAAELEAWTAELRSHDPRSGWEPEVKRWQSYGSDNRLHTTMLRLFHAWRAQAGLRPMPPDVLPSSGRSGVFRLMLDERYGEWLSVAELEARLNEGRSRYDRVRAFTVLRGVERQTELPWTIEKRSEGGVHYRATDRT